MIDLIGKLVQAESNKTRTHQEYMGKAMPDDVYARFQRLRDETIPALRTQLLDALVTSPQPSPTPQADSQPAPVLDYPPLPARRRAFLCTKCGGRECEPGTIGETHPPCKCGYLGFAEDLDFTADDMRAYVDADRAARAPADSVTAPAGGNWIDATDVNRLVRELDVALNGEAGAASQASLCDVVAQVRHEAAKRGQPLFPTPPAQAADSVLEDAADPLQGAANWLVEAHSGLETSTLARKLSIGYNRAKRLYDAARKQGGA
ncbi:hypothetical protein [Acidovorax sp.]|uniref:hypothetical protein n=1 Tax=Acidovorax sp. TaxID=1872122 RepID=UPI0031E14DBC